MIFENVTVRGTVSVPTEVFHLGPPASTTHNTAHPRRRVWHTFFIPGNPGCLFYYLPWLHSVHGLLTEHAAKAFGGGEEVDVYLHGLSHANHHLSRNGEDRDGDGDSDGSPLESEAFDMQFQIEHAAAFVDSILAPAALGQDPDSGQKRGHGQGQTLVSFVGHSIGAYIVLDLLDRRPALAAATISVQLLMPFITWRSLPALHRLRLTAFHYSPRWLVHFVAAGAVGLLQSLPLPRRTQLLRALDGADSGAAGSMDADCVAVSAARLFTRRLLRNFLAMGRQEIAQVPLDEERMLGIIQRISGTMRVLALYTDGDLWAPEGDAVRLQEHAGPYIRTAFVPGVSHGFCMRRETYAPVAAVIGDFAKYTLEWFGSAGQGQGGRRGKMGAGDSGAEAGAGAGAEAEAEAVGKQRPRGGTGIPFRSNL